MASRTDARFSTYSGAPSLQPSLAPTFESTSNSNRSSRQPSARQSTINPRSNSEKTAHHLSIYGSADAAALSTSTLDAKQADLKSWSAALERMQDERLDKQRYVMSGNKSEEVSKVALGAKVERALARRMVGQDAVFSQRKKRIDCEKRSLEVQAN